MYEKHSIFTAIFMEFANFPSILNQYHKSDRRNSYSQNYYIWYYFQIWFTNILV